MLSTGHFRHYLFHFLCGAAVLSASDDLSQWRECIKTGDIPCIRSQIDNGADIEAAYGELKTRALMQASALGHADVVDLLLQYGAEEDAKDERGATALLHAVMMNKPQVVAKLLDSGADVEAENNDGRSALYFAMMIADSDDNVRLLLENGARVNDVSGSQQVQPLMLAIFRENEGLVKILLEHGAHANAEYLSLTPLLGGIAYGNAKIVELLVQHGANLGYTFKNDLSPIDVAKIFDEPEIADFLRRETQKSGLTVKEITGNIGLDVRKMMASVRDVLNGLKKTMSDVLKKQRESREEL